MTTANENVGLFVPGRICLFGEHADWAAEYGLHSGFCIVIGTDQGLSGTAGPSENFIVQTQIPGQPAGRTRTMTCPWNAPALLAAAKDQDEFFRYCAGVAYEMFSRTGVKGGIDLRINSMDLPLKKGVSSSAAVCILVAKAFTAVYELGLFPHELMEAAYLGERLTGSQCGRMDQACIYGKTPVLLTFARQSDVRIEPVFPAGPIHMFLVDLAGEKNTIKILADLQGAYLGNEPLQRALGKENERIVRIAYRAITAGDAQHVGQLMTESQDIFDALVAPHSKDELASPRLHQLLKSVDLATHIYGGKGVGSQGDGTAQFVARSAQDRDLAMRKILLAFPDMRCFPLQIGA